MSLDQIKFRGQCVLDKGRGKCTWRYSTEFRHEDSLTNGLLGFFQKVESGYIDPATVGQWTGVCDKTKAPEYPKGRPIYVGHIVLVDMPPDEDFEANYGAVELCNGAFSINFGCGDMYPLNLHEGKDLEIIGNIHEEASDG